MRIVTGQLVLLLVWRSGGASHSRAVTKVQRLVEPQAIYATKMPDKKMCTV